MAIARWPRYAAPVRRPMPRLRRMTLVPAASSAANAAPLDVYEEGDNYVVEMALPGVRPEDVDVTVLGNSVTLRGRFPQRPEERRYLYAERAGGEFARSVTLPAEVDRDAVQAQAEHGVVRLVLPKAASARPQRIALQSGS